MVKSNGVRSSDRPWAHHPRVTLTLQSLNSAMGTLHMPELPFHAGAGYGQRRNGIKAECVESSVFAATNVKREPMQSAPDLPRFASMQHSQHAQHSEPFGCLSPTWQRAQRGRKRRQPVKREEDDSEQQRG